MDAVKIITHKRDGGELEDKDIQYLIDGYTAGRVPDYQMAAFLMASQLRGLSLRETIALTECMLNSGRILDFTTVSSLVIDKHSTGGVGDKVSLVLAPMARACGICVPMMAGRGLGHTGGTLDKLDSIPGYRTRLELLEIFNQVRETGLAIIGPTKEIAPADRLLYALRDVTASVDFIPFITASILSKKLAEGLDGLVLDVKLGRGAFMKTPEDARELAESLVHVGEHLGMNTIAWITNMDVPLGRAVGNWVEVEESILCLQGDGPEDVMEVCLSLCSEMIVLAGLTDSLEAARERAQATIDSGRALDVFAKLVDRQGGDSSVIYDTTLRMRSIEPTVITVPLDIGGYVSDIDALKIAHASNQMGTGRLVMTDSVDPEAGIVLHLRPGERVQPGAPLASFYTRKVDQTERFVRNITDAYAFSDNPVEKPNVLMDRLTVDGWNSAA